MDSTELYSEVIAAESCPIRRRRAALAERLRAEADADACDDSVPLQGEEPQRRLDSRRRDLEEWLSEKRNLFGIALSGGGIRAATISLGFLQVLNRFRILEMSDYLSTVSGGGYLGAYVHAKLAARHREANPFEKLFEAEDMKRLWTHRRYLAPGEGRKRLFTRLRLMAAFFVSTLMNMVWIVCLAATVWFLARAISQGLVAFGLSKLLPWIGLMTVILLAWHFVGHPIRHIQRRLWQSDVLYGIEASILALFGLTAGLTALGAKGGIFFEFEAGLVNWASSLIGLAGASPTPTASSAILFAACLSLFILTGFLADPNVLTMHRYYRNRVATAFLDVMRPKRRRVLLHELAPSTDAEASQAPYALINTCLNLLEEEDPDSKVDETDDAASPENGKARRPKGTRSSDYFLLSPLRCGSVLTGYADTRREPFNQLPLATAVAASGAALSPAMGYRTNRVLAFFMTMLNIRLGYWVHNPKMIDQGFARSSSWWPWYHLQELLAKAGTESRRVNISDGGHIENLGVFELLRRGCRLIIALDAGADPDFRFRDLENLIRRAREQLGLEIDFGMTPPEKVIRPAPSVGYSSYHFVVGRIRPIRGSRLREQYPSEGLLVYVKSSQRALKRLDSGNLSKSHDYKRHHPSFPHESTANQFFDRVQWEAYRRLGRFMAGDVIGEDVRDDNAGGRLSLVDLFERWGAITSEQDLVMWHENL